MYKPFHGLVRELTRRARAERRRDFDCLQALRTLIVKNLLDHGEITQIGVQTVQESIHYYLSHRIVYVSTPLAQQLLESKIEVPPDELRIPYSLFEVCFDDSLEVMPGIKAPSCLVMVKPGKATQDAILSRLGECHKIIEQLREKAAATFKFPAGKLEPPRLADKFGDAFNIHFASPWDDSICHANLPFSESVGQSVDEVIEKLDHSGMHGLYPMGAHEIECEKRLCRIVFGILCYLNVEDPDVVEFKDHNRPRMGDRPPESILLGQSFRAMPGWHLRKAHYRFLGHPRFKRGDGGNIRSVWVRETEIHASDRPAGSTEKADFVPR